MACRHVVIAGVALAALVSACSGATAPPDQPSHGSADATAPGAAPAPAGGGGQTGRPVTDIARLAEILGPGDFAAAGISGAATPTVNSPEPGSVYLVFAGLSGATGGIELDVFMSPTAQEASDAFDTSIGGLFAEGARPVDIGADKAMFNTDIREDPTHPFAALVAQKGRVSFWLSFPDSPQAPEQLAALGRLVLQRTAALV
jgi:hypothetical protein